MTSTLSPHHGHVAPSRPATGAAVVLRSTERGRVLAFVAPLALFTAGIARWVDGLDAPTGSGPLSVVAGGLLVVAVAALAWLTVALASRAEHLPVAVPTGLLAAFGAGAAGAVWLGRTVGLFDDTIPSALAAGGPVLVSTALATVLGALTVEARMPVGSLALAGAAAAVMLLPFDLLPLGALLLLISLAPLGRPNLPSESI
jgi:hypothetical protein